MAVLGNLGTMFVRDKNGQMVPVPVIRGEDGGFYTPEIKDGVIRWAASRPDMPEVPDMNIGTGGGGGTPDAVQFVPQELTDKQQAQARENIGAASAGDVSGKLDADKLPTAIESALAQAKESGEFDGEPGEPGTPPHIGTNGNWFIGDTDTGVQAQGQKGDPGYTPQKGVDYFDGAKGDPGDDYNLTEADKTEIAEEAADIVDDALSEVIGDPDGTVPAVPGYMALGMTGAAVGQVARVKSVDADGKPTAWEPVEMASGGSGGTGGAGEWELIDDITTTEDVKSIIVRFEKEYDELLVYAYGYYIEGGTGESLLKINDESTYIGTNDMRIAASSNWFYNNNERGAIFHIKKTGRGIINIYNKQALTNMPNKATASDACVSWFPDFGEDTKFELIHLFSVASQYKTGFRFTIYGRTSA